MAASAHTLAPRRRIAWPSMPRATISSNWSIGIPCTRCMQIVRGPQWSQYTSGAVIIVLSPNAPMLWRNRSCWNASRAGFSSRKVTECRSRMMPLAPEVRPHGVHSMKRAMRNMLRRSVAI